MFELVMLVPTRGRPQNAVRLHRQFTATTTHGLTDLWFIVDDDDPKVDEYHALGLPMFTHYPDRHGHGMVAALNAFANAVKNDYPYVGFMGDDHFPETSLWDTAYVNSLKAGNFFVYGDDGIQGPVMPTQVAMTSEVPRALGYMAPRLFRHLCIDVVWKMWGDAIGRIEYLPQIKMSHLHPIAKNYGGPEVMWDDTYQRGNSSEVAIRDAEVFRNWKERDFPNEIDILRGLL